MAYLDGLLFRTSNGKEVAETRSGVPMYGGAAHGFEEWKFRVSTKHKAVLASESLEKIPEKLAELVARVIDGLTDDALKMAMDIGEEELSQTAGLQTLIDKMEANVISFKEDEVKELFRAGTLPDGPLSRQKGEHEQLCDTT